MGTVDDSRCDTILALANGRERGPSAADALRPVAVGTGACSACRACRVVGIDDIRSLTYRTGDAQCRVVGAEAGLTRGSVI